jgi:DNA-binding NarL/FixJ family response regulator
MSVSKLPVYKPGTTRPLLTPKELKIIALAAQGMTNPEIAKELGNTTGTIKNKLRYVYDKLGVLNRVELTVWFENHRSVMQDMFALRKNKNRSLWWSRNVL